MPNGLTHTKVDVKRRSGFDKSFKNILTTKVGTITPIAYKLLIPNSDFNLSLAVSAALPPLASDTFMRCSLKVEAFMVPLRLLYGGFSSWLTGEEVYTFIGNDQVPGRAQLPRLVFDHSQIVDDTYVGAGTLLDYLGFTNKPVDANQDETYRLNLLPIICYHRIYDDWYRNRKIQRPLFVRPAAQSTITANNSITTLPFVAYTTIKDYPPSGVIMGGHSLLALHQRNYGSDYFTEAYPTAQFGTEQKVTIDGSSQFTISALRLANAMQRFEEKNNISSPALQDFCLVNYGAHLSDSIAQRSVYLGSAQYDVYSKGISAAAGTAATNNPFTSVGARYGNAFASGSDFVVKGHCDEPCYLMVMATLVPEANYSQGCKKDLRIFTESGSLMDLPNPSFEGIGNEPIMSSELGEVQGAQGFETSVFGWSPRYMWHKTSHNEVHGLLTEGNSLQSFVAQRSFGNAVISSSFLQIGTDDLDNVTAVNAQLSQYGVWIDSFIRLKVVEPLGESQLPSLVDPAEEHGESVYVRKNGTRLA